MLGEMTFKRIRKNQKGATVVEFAIILPLLLIMIFGILEFSLILYDKAMLTNATREAARATALFQWPGRISLDDIETVVNDYLEENRLVSFDESASPEIFINGTPIGNLTDPPCSGSQGFPNTIKIEYYYDFLFLPFGGINLDSQAEMRCE